MKKILFFILLFSISLFAKEIEGIEIPNSLTLEGQTLSLQGAGIRSKFIFDIYVGALYLKNKTNNAKKIINANSTSDIRMLITSSLVTGAKMKEGFGDDFKVIKTLGYKVDDNILKKFLQTFNTKVHKKDTYDFAYFPNKGLIIYKNGNAISAIKNINFKKALYAIWLGKKPAQESLKKKMLGE